MKIVQWNQLDKYQKQGILARAEQTASADLTQTVQQIIAQVQARGDAALKEYAAKFEREVPAQLQQSAEAIQAASRRVSAEIQQAIQQAAANIQRFHQAQQLAPIELETTAGVICRQVTRPIEKVGLYIPAGTAPLLSTVLMLAIPSQIAGCKQVILCSPSPIADEILYAAHLCGVTQIYACGGAQAIAAMSFGTESIPKVDKIFGPGNSFVTEAKRQVSQTIGGAAIDMPAGPSEVLIIADHQANAAFVAADLLSQAEHGADSQAMLVTDHTALAEQVQAELAKQLPLLPRAEIAAKALAHSAIIIAKDLAQCVTISNRYAPEHLIIQTENDLVPQIQHAGSVFVGRWSPESVGDYASGTNHVLPTYGFARTCSCLGLADFQKRMTIQQLSKQGLMNIAHTVEVMAEAELLHAHARAVSLRREAL